MKGVTIFGLVLFGIWVAAIVGWVRNIIDIVHTVSDPLTGLFILRCVGIVVAPLGAILGYC